MSDPDAKFVYLSAISEAQRLAACAMFKANDLKNRGMLPEAETAYEEQIHALGRALGLEEEHNLRFPESPMDSAPAVNQLIDALLTFADVMEADGRLSIAESLRGRAERLSENRLGPDDKPKRLRQRAVTLIPQGRFNEAIMALAEARDLCRERGDALGSADASATLAETLEWLEDWERARMEAETALDLIGRQESRPNEILSNLASGRLKDAEKEAVILKISLSLEQLRARVNVKLGNLEEAEKQFLAVYPRLPGNIADAGIGFHLAAIRVHQGRHREALDVMERIEPAFRGLVRAKLGVLLGLRGEAMLGLGHLEEALAAEEESCLELSKYNDRDSLWKSEWRRAKSLAALGRVESALESYRSAVNTIQTLRKAPLGYRLDSTYLRDKIPVFSEGIRLAADCGDARTCCLIMEQVKSRTLTAALSVPTSDEDDEAGIGQEIDALSGLIDATHYRAYKEGWTEEVRLECTRLQEKRSELLERQQISDPRWRSLSEPIPFNEKAVRDSLLEARQAALSLYLESDSVTCVLLTGDLCTVEQMELSADTKRSLDAYTANLTSERSRPEYYDISSSLRVSAEQLIPATLLEKALAYSSIIVIPHGPLHLVPWAGLTFMGKRLVEYVPVGILPNLTCFGSMSAAPANHPRIALIGAPDYGRFSTVEPLAMAGEELRTIADIYGPQRVISGKAYTDSEATGKRFWEMATGPEAQGNILHAACHGDFITGEPLSSGLLFSDGKVDAARIARRRVSCNEVVLSACASGFRPVEVKGIELTGDDIIGLPGALLEAGARSVLLSISKVRDDAAMRFMTIYHQSRSEGLPPLAALQKTQIEMLKNPLHETCLWIGFTLYGCR